MYNFANETSILFAVTSDSVTIVRKGMIGNTDISESIVFRLLFSPTPIMSSSDIQTPSEIISLIPDRFKAALQSEDLLFFPSTIHPHEESRVKVRS